MELTSILPAQRSAEGVRESQCAEPQTREVRTSQSNSLSATSSRERWNEIRKSEGSKSAHVYYLKTSHWRSRRRPILERDQHRCVQCHSTKTLQVHHKTYARLWKERDDDLVTVCTPCHNAIHKAGKISDIKYLAGKPVTNKKVNKKVIGKKVKSKTKDVSERKLRRREKRKEKRKQLQLQNVKSEERVKSKKWMKKHRPPSYKRRDGVTLDIKDNERVWTKRVNAS